LLASLATSATLVRYAQWLNLQNRISDSHLDLRGFLEGSEHAPMRWFPCAPSSPFTPEELQRLEIFRVRAREYLKNHGSIETPNQHNLVTKSWSPKIKIETNIYPGKTRAKALYMDFRFLILDNEKSQAKSIINILKRRTQANPLLHRFLDTTKAHIVDDEAFSFNANGKTINLETFTNLKFNTEYFHVGDADQTADMKHINETFEEDSIQQLLFWAVYSKWYPVQCLYASVKDIESETSPILCPDPRIVELTQI
jgi:hypothetical protein